MPNLTPKQAAFVREYLTDYNASQAAQRAGLTADYGRQLLTKSHVRDEIDRLASEAESDAVMSAREVLERLSLIARGEGEADKATSRGVWRIGPEWSDQTRALDLLAKHHGVLKERIELTTQKRPEDMTDEELEEVLARASRNA